MKFVLNNTEKYLLLNAFIKITFCGKITKKKIESSKKKKFNHFYAYSARELDKNPYVRNLSKMQRNVHYGTTHLDFFCYLNSQYIFKKHMV